MLLLLYLIKLWKLLTEFIKKIAELVFVQLALKVVAASSTQLTELFSGG
jgi:hypothetical protein